MKESQQGGEKKRRSGKSRFLKIMAFPFAMAFVYAVLCLVSPDRAFAALKASGRVLFQIAPALCLAFVVMVLLNALVRPSHIRRFLGRRVKVKGVIFSTTAGILSMGPIYAWYPLLKDLREKGASDFHLANFLCCRAVKPALIPLMVSFFGWSFTLILGVLTILSAMLTGFIVSRWNSR